MKVLILGPVPTIKDDTFDDFDYVIRMSHDNFKGLYGDRIDFILTTTLQFSHLKVVNLQNTQGIWVYRTQRINPGTNWKDIDKKIRRFSDYNGEIVHVNKYIYPWLEIYEQNAEPVSDRHPRVTYPSKGFACILSSLLYLKPDEIHLFAFDDIWNGERTDSSHDFKIENEIIRLACRNAKVELFHVV